MSIQTLSIKNFKSHRDTKLDFSPGVNVILGRSQAGKTNVMRALLLLSTNKPGGAKFFSNFAGKKGSTQIGVTLDDESKITLSKLIEVGKEGEKVVKGARYTIDKGALGWDSFEGFGAGVPDVIKDKLNLSELNIQKQFDMPFLVMASAGEIARTINRITKLEKVDQWTSNLTSKINSCNQQTKIYEDEMKGLKQDLIKYKDTQKAQKHIELVVGATQEIELLNERKGKIEHTVGLLNQTTQSITGIEKALEISQKVNEIGELETKISSSVNLENKILDLIELEKKISNETLAVDKIKPKVKTMVDLTNKITDLLDLSYNINQYLDANINWRSLTEQYAEAKGKYITELKKIGKCPLCWSEIDESCIGKIIEEL